MPDSTFDIESIVKQVLAEIRAASDDGIYATVDASSQLTINSPVVTLEQIESHLDGAKQLVVSRGAVVTPSVRDLLRGKNVALTFSTGTDEKVEAGRKNGFCLSLMATLIKPALKFDRDALTRGLLNDGIRVDLSTSDCLIETTDRFAALLDDGPLLGAIVTSHPAPAICLANRLPGVRAVAPATPADVARDAKAVGANLIVINPAGRGIFQTKQMIREFCSNGPRECPPALAQRLK